MIKKLLGIIKNENSVSLIGNLVFAFFGFANMALLARSYNKDIFGEWVLFITGLSFVEMLRIGITRTPLVRFLAGSKDPFEAKDIIAASWFINLISTLLIIILLYASYFLFQTSIRESGFYLFFVWYPLLSVAILPMNQSISIFQARKQFEKILWFRLITMGSFFVFIVINWLVLNWPVYTVVIAYIISFCLGSLSVLFTGNSGLQYLRYTKKEKVKEQLNFGKFSLGTLMGSNLLKSSDSFIIGILLTKADAAFYGVPLKLIEVIEIPLRSFIAVALPGMAKESRNDNPEGVRKVFYSYSGLITLLFIPFLALLFIFAEPLVILMGGKEYAEAASIFRIFLFYALILPVDRFSGVTLDAINRPRSNMTKVFYMAIANIVGDILAIKFLGSLEAVAVVTILNVAVGAYVGYYYLRKELNVHYRNIPGFTKKLIKEQIQKFRKS